MKSELEEARETIESLKSQLAVPNPQIAELKSQLETCLAQNTTMEREWMHRCQELEQVQAERDYHAKLSKVQADSLSKLKEELEQMEHAQEQLTLHIQSLDKQLGEVKEERDRYKQKWEQSIIPTDAGSSSATTTTTKLEAASIVPQQAPVPVQTAKPRKRPTALDLTGMADWLGVTKGAVSNAKTKDKKEPGYFKDWSAGYDPDNIPWKFWEDKQPPYRPTK